MADAFSAAVNAAGGQVVKREYTTDKEFDANGDLKHGSLSIFRVAGGKWVLQE